MLICQNYEGVRGQRKVGNHCSRTKFVCFLCFCFSPSSFYS